MEAVPEKRVISEEERWFHGALAQEEWEFPVVAAKCEDMARPGYDSKDATEYLDTPETLKSKIRMLAQMMRASPSTVVYTGAGISTSSGVGDYATKAKGSVAPKTKQSINRLKHLPTPAHKAIAAIERKHFVQHWLQQNHDRLAQKAGFPQAKINPIHGEWGDSSNPVLMMDDKLRPDLLEWLEEWKKGSTLCIAMGTSLCGMTSDGVADATAERYAQGQGQGLVIINLQKTAYDERASFRSYAKSPSLARTKKSPTTLIKHTKQ